MRQPVFRGLSFLLFVLVAGCGANSGEPQDPSTTAKDEEGMICHDEAPVGTHFTRRVCRRDEDVAQERQRTQTILSQPNARPGTGNN